jgi:hypothetical protein
MTAVRLLLVACVAFAPVPAHAIIIADFKSLDHLIDNADAIAVVRIEKNIDPNMGPDLGTTHECYIYATLKGDPKPADRVPMRLMDTRGSFVSPYGIGSTHLLFLKKDAGGRWSYRSLQVQGSNLPTAPEFRDATIKGLAVKDAVKALVREYSEYRDRKLRKEKELLDKVLGEK